MRLFIAVEIPDEIKKNIVELINELKKVEASIKWVEEKNLHITLKFLGSVEDKDLEKLISMVSKTVEDFGGFKVNFSGMGTFPEGKAPRVVWVGTTEGGETLVKLADGLENSLSPAGFRSEQRAFKPHLTIGRIKEKKGVDKLKVKMALIKNPKFGEAMIDRIFIMKSTLTAKGPIYEKIREVKI
jgi:2'-5' RNA ligase